jgi:predicted aconitase with swiveling domain
VVCSKIGEVAVRTGCVATHLKEMKGAIATGEIELMSTPLGSGCGARS